MAPRVIAVVCGMLGCMGCAPGASSGSPRAAVASKPLAGEFLAFPHSAPESLLGREVRRSSEGGLQIADVRSPGCEVLVRRTRAAFRVVRETKVSDLAVLSAGIPHLVSLTAKYGRDSHASIELENTEILEGDFRGSCGSKVVAKLFVGRGKRRIHSGTVGSAGAAIATPTGGVAPSAESRRDETDEVAWQEDQAYAFETSDLSNHPAEAVAITAQVPSIVTEGEDVRVVIETSQPAWLVVYYIDSRNNAEVLWPSNEEPAPRAGPKAPAALPSQTELAAGMRIRPALPPGVPSVREQLVVYAFTDRRDFELARPPSGASSTGGGDSFAETMARKLRDIPASRWSRAQLGYTIQSKRK